MRQCGEGGCACIATAEWHTKVDKVKIAYSRRLFLKAERNSELSSHYFKARNGNDTFFGAVHITAGNSNPTEYPSNELSFYE